MAHSGSRRADSGAYQAKPNEQGASGLAITTVRWMLRLERHQLAIARHLGCSLNEIQAMFHIDTIASVTVSTLATQLQTRPGVASAMVDRLESKRFIERQKDPSDRRIRLVTLTGARAPELIEARLMLMRSLSEVVNPDDLDIAAALLELNDGLAKAATILEERARLVHQFVDNACVRLLYLDAGSLRRCPYCAGSRARLTAIHHDDNILT